MTPGYQELVGLQVTFDKVMPRYSLVHYYKRELVVVKRPILVMRGYDMVLQDDPGNVTASLRKAYQPAILTVWKQDTALSASEYLQFQVGSRPDELELDGEWSIVT